MNDINDIFNSARKRIARRLKQQAERINKEYENELNVMMQIHEEEMAEYSNLFENAKKKG